MFQKYVHVIRDKSEINWEHILYEKGIPVASILNQINFANDLH